MKLLDYLPLRPGDPGEPRLRADVVAVVTMAVVAAVAARLVLPASDHELVVIAGAVFAAELLTFPLADGTALPAWIAPLLPLVAGADAGTVAAVVVATQLLALPVLWRDAGRAAPLRVVQRLAGALAAWGAYRLTVHAVGAGGVALTLPALGAAAAVAVLTEVAGRRLAGLRPFGAAGGYEAALAQASSGVLMALALLPDTPGTRMGVWGLALFAIPLLGARYAYGRLQAIRHAYDQTIVVLSGLPEHGGYVRPGHPARVAALCIEIGRRMGLSATELDDLERAALLHSVGYVTLDPARGEEADGGEVSRATAAMLVGAEGLSRPAGIVAAVPLPYRAPEVSLARQERVAAQILKVASAYEDATGGDDRRAADALEALYSAPGYLYDPRVLGTLERILDRRGVPVGA